MDIGAYRRYLEEVVREALQYSDGSNSGIAEYLREKRVGGIFVRHKQEKKRALADALQAFENNQHWPVDIVVSHLGLDPKELHLR